MFGSLTNDPPDHPRSRSLSSPGSHSRFISAVRQWTIAIGGTISICVVIAAARRLMDIRKPHELLMYYAPASVARGVGFATFYPTLWYNILEIRWNPEYSWWNAIDDTIILGAFPYPEHARELYDLGVRAVVNCCEEFPGPLVEYERVGIEELRLPIPDYTPPTLEQVVTAISFIQSYKAVGQKVYVHCKAGKARSATIAFAYLYTQGHTPDRCQSLLLEKRKQVSNNLFDRPGSPLPMFVEQRRQQSQTTPMDNKENDDTCVVEDNPTQQ